MHRILVGTHNVGKINEIKAILGGLSIEVCGLRDYRALKTVDETGDTYEENSRLKALSYASWTKVPTLADDSGLEVNALRGLPGVKSARFGGELASDADRIQKLLGLLEGRPEKERAARFVCCLTFAGWDSQVGAQDSEPKILCVTRGEVEGRITFKPSGVNGFGYDPIFLPEGYSQTMAELPADTKNKISHRGKALELMKANIDRWIMQT